MLFSSGAHPFEASSRLTTAQIYPGGNPGGRIRHFSSPLRVLLSLSGRKGSACFPYFFCPRCFLPRKESRMSFGSKGGVTRGREDQPSGGGLDLRETRAREKR